MNEVMGVILTENADLKLGELTTFRALGAVPIAGRYRIIDFILSNMANSGVQRIGVTTQYNYRSLMYHLGAGKPWNLNRKDGGLFILPPYVTSDSIGVSKGTITTIYSIIEYIRSSNKKYVIVADCNAIGNIDFGQVLEFHKQKDSDITMVYIEQEEYDQQSKSAIIDVDKNGRVFDIEAAPKRPKTKNVGTNMYVMERIMLDNLIEDCVARGENDFVSDILRKNLRELNIYGYKFEGYCRIIYDVKSYFNFNKELLELDKRNQLFLENRRIHTNIKDSVATKYGNNAVVNNSMIADGCIIDGEVENSIIFRGVRVMKDSKVKNSIIMHDCQISDGCELENVILDKEVVISEGGKLVGRKNFPLLVEKRGTI